MARRPRKPPADYLTARGTWPEGPFRADAPPYVPVVAHIAAALLAALADRGLSQRALARDTGLTVSTINDLANGALIPDAATLATLEQHLGVTLWPSTHS
ncbi:MAG: helix-turn-helix transcriptional regulator [Candidatus Nanopelagicales bacterium]|nr:helix-turn-helix transcriptional regulator [Candidatus Nanopelagicales bacterium]